MKVDAQTQKILLIGGAIWAGYKFILAPILETLNLKDTKAEEEAAKLKAKTENATYTDDYWRANYYKRVGFKSILLTESSAANLAKEIYNAKGALNDDEERIYGAFRLLKYKTQVSFLSLVFYALYKQDLYTWLRDSVLNVKELNTVLQITDKLPSGFVR